MKMPSAVNINVLKEVGKRGLPLHDVENLSALIEQVSQARIVMLGEASHGTHDFYHLRSFISQQLIANHGFQFVAVEGDWPAAQIINRELLNLPASSNKKPPSARDVLVKAFTRWPTWMWANRETEGFIEWLRGFNEKQQGGMSAASWKPVRFYGLDLYSLFESIEVVLEELQKVEPALAEKAKKHYACFDPYEKSEQEYMYGLLECPEGCKAQAIKVLQDVRRSNSRSRRKEEGEEGEEDFDDIAFDIEQNAKIAVDAENYYRKVMFGRSSESWNVRDRHMIETLDKLLGYHDGREACKAIVWAHNTHIGDYRFTQMGRDGSVNIGGLAREKYGEDCVALVGFGTHRGHVVAAHAWGARTERMPVPPAKEGSYEDLLHNAMHFVPKLADSDIDCRLNSSSAFRGLYLLMRKKQHGGDVTVTKQEVDGAGGDDAAAGLQEWRGNRAIGVVYDPALEKWGNYVPTVLASRYDAFVFVDESTAVQPLTGADHFHDPHRELPETWPFGL